MYGIGKNPPPPSYPAPAQEVPRSQQKGKGKKAVRDEPPLSPPDSTDSSKAGPSAPRHTPDPRHKIYVEQVRRNTTGSARGTDAETPEEQPENVNPSAEGEKTRTALNKLANHSLSVLERIRRAGKSSPPLHQRIADLFRETQFIEVDLADVRIKKRQEIGKALQTISSGENAKTNLASLKVDFHRILSENHQDVMRKKIKNADLLDTEATVAILSSLSGISRIQTNPRFGIYLNLAHCNLNLTHEQKLEDRTSINPFDRKNSRLKALSRALEEGANIVEINLKDNLQEDPRILWAHRPFLDGDESKYQDTVPAGIHALKRGLPQSRVASLDLSRNNFGEKLEAFQALCSALPKTLTRLNLADNRLNSQCMAELVHALKDLRNLTMLDVSGEWSNAESLLRGLAENKDFLPKLSELSIEHEDPSKSSGIRQGELLRQIMQSRPGLKIDLIILPWEPKVEIRSLGDIDRHFPKRADPRTDSPSGTGSVRNDQRARNAQPCLVSFASYRKADNKFDYEKMAEYLSSKLERDQIKTLDHDIQGIATRGDLSIDDFNQKYNQELRWFSEKYEHVTARHFAKLRFALRNLPANRSLFTEP